MADARSANSFQLSTGDVGEAEDSLRRIGAPARIARQPRRKDEAFRFDVAAQGDADVTFATFSAAGRFSIGVQLDVVVVASSMSGTVGWRSGGADGVMDPVVLPVGPSIVEIAGPARVFEVQFSTPALLRYARDYYDVEHADVRFQAGGARTPRHRHLWLAALQYTRAFVESGAAADPALLSALKANLAVSLLSGFRVSATRREWRLPDQDARRTYRRAADFIEAHARRPITVTDVAREVSLPLELLDASFRRQTGRPVGAYLATARMSGAHGDLARSTRDGAAVSAIARRWGFRSADHLLRRHAAAYPQWQVPPAAER